MKHIIVKYKNMYIYVDFTSNLCYIMLDLCKINKYLFINLTIVLLNPQQQHLQK